MQWPFEVFSKATPKIFPCAYSYGQLRNWQTQIRHAKLHLQKGWVLQRDVVPWSSSVPNGISPKTKTHLHQIPTRKLPPVATESPETNKKYQQPSIKEEPEKMHRSLPEGFNAALKIGGVRWLFFTQKNTLRTERAMADKNWWGSKTFLLLLLMEEIPLTSWGWWFVP